MATRLTPICIAACLLLTCACTPRQNIPVSTDPIGATIYADGKKICVSPCPVKLDKRSDHLLTIVKEGYEQEEIILKRRFKPDQAIRDGVISGIIKGGDPGDIASGTAREMDEQERSGEAYELEPPIVTIKLTPAGKEI